MGAADDARLAAPPQILAPGARHRSQGPGLWAAVRFKFKDAAVTLLILALIMAVFMISGDSQFDFLTKPVRDQTLLDAVIAGMAMDAARRAEAAIVKRNVDRVATLTPREREVLQQVARETPQQADRL